MQLDDLDVLEDLDLRSRPVVLGAVVGAVLAVLAAASWTGIFWAVLGAAVGGGAGVAFLLLQNRTHEMEETGELFDEADELRH